MGHMCYLWKLLEDIRRDNERGTHAPDSVDVIDFRQILDLVEKSICCIGQANVSINYNRRLEILKKINEDSKKARTLLRDNQDCLASNDKFLFGNDFKEELKEWGKARKEASEMARALGGKKGGRKFPKPRGHNYKSSDYSKPPFRSRPPIQSQTHRQGASNYGVGGGNSGYKGSQRHRFFKSRKFENRYVKLSFRNMQVNKTAPCSGISEVGLHRATQQSVEVHTKSKIALRPTRKSSVSRKAKILCTKLVRNNNGSNDLEKHTRDRNKFYFSSYTVKCPNGRFVESGRDKFNVSRGAGNAEQGSHNSSSKLSGSVPQHLVSGSKEGRGVETCIEPKISKSPCSLPTFQDGGVVHGKGSSPEGRFHAKNRSERGILSGPNLQKTSKISAFHMGGETVRVHGLALRPGRGSKVVHQNYETSSGAAEKVRDASDYLLGRHS